MSGKKIVCKHTFGKEALSEYTSTKVTQTCAYTLLVNVTTLPDSSTGTMTTMHQAERMWTGGLRAPDTGPDTGI